VPPRAGKYPRRWRSPRTDAVGQCDGKYPRRAPFVRIPQKRRSEGRWNRSPFWFGDKDASPPMLARTKSSARTPRLAQPRLGLSRASGSELRDRGGQGGDSPGSSGVRAADWIRCISRYAANHTGPTRTRPRERSRMGGGRGGDSDGARDCSAGQACGGDPTLADARASVRGVGPARSQPTSLSRFRVCPFLSPPPSDLGTRIWRRCGPAGAEAQLV
jgi:hypothetical protein